MTEAPVHYTKLPGPSTGWSGRTRLWLAEDHLLEVNSSLFTERYHRYFLHDIRSVIAQRTKTGLYWNIALACLISVALVIAAGFYWGGKKVPDHEGQIALWIVAGMFASLALLILIALIINTLFGPTCRFYIQTTAGSRLIAAPSRLRRADRLLANIVPHIESVQSVPPT